MSFRRIAVLGLLVAVVGAVAASWWLPRSRTPNILLISIDTLRPDHLSLYGYVRKTSPEIDEFFREADLYERAYSAEANTAPSVVSMLTGLHPARHGVRLFYQRLEDHVPTLADRLSARGYQTAAVVSNVVLTAEALGLDERFDHYDDFVDERESARKIYERSAARTTNAAIEWLRAHHDPARPHLLWVHYIDPHGPYRPPADKPTDFTHRDDVVVDPSRIPGYQRIPERMTDGLEYVDRYDEEIAYLDRELGRLLETYEKLGLADDAVIVLTADHGETMIEHEKLFSHGFHVWDAIMRVPLVIRRPDRVGRRVAEPVSLVDLVPTLLAYAGLDPPKDVDGHVLDQRPANAPVSLEATRTQRLGQMRAAVIGEHKWFAQVGPNGRIVRRWYADLNTDGDVETQHPWPGDLPGGTLLESWVSEDPDPAGIPRRYEKGLQLRAPKVAPGRSEREIEALRALGYVE